MKAWRSVPLTLGGPPGRLAQMSWVAGPAHLPQGVPGGQGPDVKGKPERCYSLIYINLIIVKHYEKFFKGGEEGGEE